MSDTDVLWRTYANASRAGAEIDALLVALEELLADGGLGALRVDPDDQEEEELETDQRWAIGYSLFRYRIVRARGRAVTVGWLSLGVSFWRPEDERGRDWPGARMAKLYVAFTPPRSVPWSATDLVVDGSGRTLDAVPLSARRWRGEGAGGRSASWFFCVGLLALESREDLEREVATPLRLLLDGGSEERAFENVTALLAPLADATSEPPSPVAADRD